MLSKIWGSWLLLLPVQQRFGNVGLRAKSRLLKESGDNTGPESANENVSTTTNTRGDNDPGVKVTLENRVLHARELCTLRSYLVRTR